MGQPARLHVVGTSPRSGTTLIYELITACFDIQPFGTHEESLFRQPDPPPGLPYASKTPTDLVHVRRVIRWDPSLHVLCMQRDPRDVIVSRHGRFEGRYWCDFDIWRRSQTLLPNLLEHPRFFLCRYEDLVADPDRMQRALQDRFGFLVPRHAFSRFHEVAQSSEAARLALNGLRRVEPAQMAKWRGDLPRIAAQFQRFPDLPRHLVRAGYEPDGRWQAVLDTVEPDRSESVRAQHDILRGRAGVDRALRRVTRRLSSLRAELAYVLRAMRAMAEG